MKKMSYRIEWTNKQTGITGTGRILTKEIDVKGGKSYRIPMDEEEVEAVC